jgi:fatty acid desaturase
MNIKANTQKIHCYRTPVGRDVLKELTKRSDLRGLLDAGSFLLIYAGFVALAVYLFLKQLWLPMAVVCYFLAVFVDSMGMEAVVHEMSHGTP